MGRLLDRLQGSPLGNRNYALFMAGAFVTALGSWMQSVALGWTVLQLGNSAFLLGLLGFAQLAPVLVFGLYAGGLADRVDRRKFLIAMQSLSTALAALLAIITATGRATISALLLIAAANGTVNALNGPTWQAFIKELVGPADLRRAIALNSARFNLTRIIGPAIGGWLLIVAGAAACFAANAVSFLAVIGALLVIRSTRQPTPANTTRGLAATLAVARTPRIRAVLLPAIGLTILALPYNSFLPSLARDVFAAGASGLSLLLTAMGLGALVGAGISSMKIVERMPERSLAGLEVVCGVALAGLAWSPHFSLALVSIGVFGAALIGYMATANATIQLAAPPGTEGRALGLWIIVNSGLVPLGSIAIGGVAEWIGTRNALGGAGLGCVICGIAAAFIAARTFGPRLAEHVADRRPATSASRTD